MFWLLGDPGREFLHLLQLPLLNWQRDVSK
jgi:hypothetical protein